MFYPSGAKPSDHLPIAVWIHGGEWRMGGRGDQALTPSFCGGQQTIACWLAAHNYVVFSIDYTLVTTTAQGTDLTIPAPKTVRSASHVFKTSDIGSTMTIPSVGGGWSPGGYRVVAVSNGEAQLDTSPGTVGATQGNYTLLETGTLWPAQWQDCNCFLRYLAEQAGVSVPGDPHNIVLMGHSAGGHLSGIAGLSGNGAFRTNCDHTSVNYTVKGILAYSPATDLVTLFSESPSTRDPIENLLGCIPGYGTCDSVARSASIPTYVAENLPEYVSFSGAGDTSIPPVNVQETQAAFAALTPSVWSPWIEFGPSYSHPLDLFYYSDCAANNEPSPCGSAGAAFQTSVPYIQTWTGR